MAQREPEIFDLCVIGCGPGGFAGAMRALDLGKHVCIIERADIGGAGVMWGALASKTMWELARDYKTASLVDRGYRAAGLTVDYQAVRRTVLKAVKEKQYQMLSQIETFSPRRWEGPGSVTLKNGSAAFAGPDTITITTSNGEQETIRSKNFLIATGSRPRSLPNIKTDQKQVIDSDAVLCLEDFPKRLMIIGAGIIGCEYATIFANFGQTEVFLVDHKDRVIPYEDEDISDFVSAHLQEKGVTIFHSASVKTVHQKSTHLEVVLDFEDGRSEVVEVDTVLVSVGRKASLTDLNLESAAVRTKGILLKTDDHCRMQDHIYAAGDVTPHPDLVNLAEMESRYAAQHMFGMDQPPLTYTNMSTIMFFDPAVAAVGLNEKTCRKRKIPFRVAYYSSRLVPRAIAMRSLNGFVKIIVTDDSEHKILGMRAAGPHASSTIMSIAHFMDQGKGIGEMLKSVYPHPTITESIQECLRLIQGDSVYKPRAFPQWMKIRAWDGENGYRDL